MREELVMENEMDKVYDPKNVEDRLYEHWERRGYFHAVPNSGKEPFTIVIPPPNITGQLHMGHALDQTWQDAIIRSKRMQGYEALWMPGTDHASIATEVKIVEQMATEGLTKLDLGREGFLKRAWAWKEEYGSRIVQQLKKIGGSCDWERERFTLDDGLTDAVLEAFVNLYNQGLIYQGDRIINWCPTCKTALSDAEVEYEEQASYFWHIRYMGEDGSEGVVVATTRPETMLGDSGVAVHPDDERYQHLIGKNVVLPLLNRLIPVVADEYVDREFGTGAVKMTPAHDPNDFEVGQRHNLEMIRVMNDDGSINELGGKYEGLDRFEARKQIVEDLKAEGVLVEIEDHTHNVGTCYRCGTTVETIISKQWFVSMNDLAQPAIKAVQEGDIEFIPERFDKTYFNWMNNIRDWCISRQLWWGHRIPAYYCDECGEVVVQKTKPEQCPKCHSTHMHQDEDVLDTWFSSALWPFSTLGWPEKTEELAYFYPTNVLVTGYDIIFFWVARMIMFGYSQMGEKPFSSVLIHGLVRDAQGRKMSKSLGNGIDPLEIIEEYGADSLRFSLITGNSPGNDMRFSDEKVSAARNFANKIWNASRFVLMNIPEDMTEYPVIDPADLDIADQWMLTRLNRLISDVTAHLDEYDLGLALQKLYDAIWNEFCDWYIEMTKSRLYGENEKEKQTAISVLVHTLIQLLKLLHPFMPFITEEIYQYLPGHDETIMLSAWPVPSSTQNYLNSERAMEDVMEAIRGIRNIRSEMDVPPSKKVRMTVVCDADHVARFEAAKAYLMRLAYANEVIIQSDKKNIDENDVSVVTAAAEMYMPLSELIDINKEIDRLEKEEDRLKNEVKRSEGKLNNVGFTSKAPENVVAEVRENLEKYKDMLKKVDDRLQQLKK